MKLLRLPFVPFLFLAVGLIRLLGKCGFVIRIGEFWSDRIGHLAGNTECYLSEKDAGLQKGWDIWFHREPISNPYLAKMYARIMRVDRTGIVRLLHLINSWFKGWEKHAIQTIQVDRDIFNLWEKHGPHLKFTAEEEARGQAFLRACGLPEGAKFVTLIVRDDAYLPHLGYHSYRDADVTTYEMAIAALASRGYYIFRMGAKVKKKLGFRNDGHVIDYATNGMYSDFTSIYLGAKCEFCISSGCGYDAIPAVFQRPICFTNYVPVEYLQTWIKSLAIWKHHVKDGKRMSFKEIIESGAGQFMEAKDFEDAKITLEGNSPEEIRDVVLEMLSQQTNTSQDGFWKCFPNSISPYNGRNLHGERRMRIGSEFLCSVPHET